MFRLLITVLLLIYTSVSLGSESLARVVFLRGTVTAIDETAKTPRILRKDSWLAPGETVETGPKALAQIAFPDRSLLYVKAASRVKLAAVRFAPKKPEEDSMVTDILKGGMRALTGAVGKRSPDKTKYNTRVSTIGIRGTALGADEQEGDAWLATLDFGQAYVENESGRLDLDEGEGVIIPSLSALGERFKIVYDKHDPAVLARSFNGMPPAQIVGKVGGMCSVIPAENAILLIGMEGQAPAFNRASLLATVQGLTECLPPDELSALLTAMAILYPDVTRELLGVLIKAGVDITLGLQAIMNGVIYLDGDRLEPVLEEAISLGITQEQANEILNGVGEGGICR